MNQNDYYKYKNLAKPGETVWSAKQRILAENKAKKVEMVSNLSNIIEVLRTETQSLLKQYLEFTEKYAKEMYAMAETRSKWNRKQWYEFCGIPYVIVPATMYNSEHVSEPDHHSWQYRKFMNCVSEVNSIMRFDYDKFLARELKGANIHYEDSLVKLAQRIEKKGLDWTKVKVVTSHIGVNIETRLSDGNKTVRAFTIVASGPIQRPHYRYLIK